MPNYRVLVDSLTGKNGRRYYRGDSVTEDNFISVDELHRQGFLEKIEIINEEPKIVELEMDDLTRQGWMRRLDELGVKYSGNASKRELYLRWKGL